MSRQRMKRAGHQAAQMLRARTDHLYRILQTAPHSKERLEAVKLACRELDLSKSRLYELLAVYSLHGFEALKRKRRSDCILRPLQDRPNAGSSVETIAGTVVASQVLLADQRRCRSPGRSPLRSDRDEVSLDKVRNGESTVD